MQTKAISAREVRLKREQRGQIRDDLLVGKDSE